MSPNTSSEPAYTWIGHILAEDKPINTFRITFNNINSLGAHQYHHTIQQIAETQQSLGIDYLGMTEHCLNTTQPNVMRTIQNSLRRHHLGRYILQMNSSETQTATPYLPGGTAALLMGDNISRLEPNGRNGDSMGRWSYMTLRRHHKPPITIYTVYQVNAQPTNDIGITAWHQQRLHLNEQNRSSIHPRMAFTDDLIASVHTMQQQNHEIIIGGDFNDTLHNHRSNILRLATHTGLIDPWTQLFPDHSEFSTYFRGSKRIDAILCTPTILGCIRAFGYSPYNWLTNSDHRAIVLDVDEKSFFGCDTDTLPPLNLRGIRTNDRQQVAVFIRQWYSHLAANNAFSRIKDIDSDSITTPEIESLDRLIGQGGDSAERKCRRRRSTLYSNKLSTLRTLKSITYGNLRTIRMGKKQTNTFQTRVNRHNLGIQLESELQAAQHQYNTIKQEFDEATKHHREQRLKEQDEMIEKALSQGKRPKATAIQRIKRHEARRRTWQILQFTKKRRDNDQKLDRLEIPLSWPQPDTDILPTTRLEDPKICKDWTTITDPDAIEHYLKLRNRSHFGQAQGTPFTVSPFVESLDWAASTDCCESILAGQSHHLISEVPQCQALLATCKAATDLDLIPAEINSDDFAGKIKSWKETTSTSPSGRHLGRYKALYAKGPFESHLDTEEEAPYKQFVHEQSAIAQLLLSILNHCIRNGHILERWKTIVNTMIFKDPGNYKIHRLRVIHIYEADFNLLLAVKWRHLMRSAEERQLINHGLFGGRPGCEAQSLTFLEELKYDISYTSRRTLFNFDNDATSCYDRIILSLASLINRRYGQHRKVVLVHAITLREARFHLRTKLGYSASSYTHHIQYPIYGSGQGSGNSPSIWLFISSTLCDLHEQLAHGATFISPDGHDKIHISIVGFVDDSTGICNDFQPQSQIDHNELSSRMQHDAQLWNDLLWCSGGKLELPKCSYHVLRFKFKPNGEPRPILETPPHPIMILDSETNEMIPIPPKRADDAHKTLGHWKAPADPRQAQQLSTLTTKGQQVMSHITTSPLSRFGATLAYLGIYIPGLKYVLPQCFFPEHQLYRAERKTIQPILAKCGYNRNTALELRYAPITYAGCGFVKWYTIQGEGQIQLFIKHWRTDTMISMTLRVALGWSQWQSGLSNSILHDTRTILPHLECRWIKSLRTFLHKIHATITLENPRTVPHEREFDQHIMESVISSKLFSLADIKIINYCRLYLHVTTISELFDATGQHILPYMYNCTRPAWFDKTKYVTLQPRPSDYQIRTKWKRFCRQWCTSDGVIAASVTLGRWLPSTTTLRPRRESYYTFTRQHPIIYHWVDTSYWLLTPISDYDQQHYKPDHPTSWQPDDHAVPIRITRVPHTNGAYTYHRSQPISLSRCVRPHPQRMPTCAEFSIYRATLPTWEQNLLQDIELDPGVHSLMEYIHDIATTTNKRLLISFAGMSSHTTTSYGWIIGTNLGHKLAWKKGTISESSTKHRAAQYGHLSALRFLSHLPTLTDRPYPSNLRLLTTTDNSQAITSIKKRRKYHTSYPNATLMKDWDIVEQIHHTYNDLGVSTSPLQWIRGNQDRQRAFDRLPQAARYIIDTNALLNEDTPHPLPSGSNTRPSPIILPSARCTLQIRNQPIYSNYTKHIREAAALPDLHSYLRRRYKWSKTISSDIQWRWFQSAVRTYSHTDNHLMKLVYDYLPTRMTKSKAGGQSWLPCVCQHCHTHPETFDHLLQCHHDQSAKFRKELVNAIKSLCKKRSIPLNFQTTLTDILQDWFEGIPPLELRMNTPAVNALIHAQRKIGWTRFLRGFLSHQWLRYLEYEQNHNTKPTPATFDSDDFFRTLIKTIWEHQSTFWKEYQHTLHQKPSDHSPTRESLLHEIRHLYALRESVAKIHRNEYFPMNLHRFLHTSSTAQLQNYVLNYKQPILRSVKLEKQRPDRTRRIWSFYGFTRSRSNLTQPHVPHVDDGASLLMPLPPTPSIPTALSSAHSASLPQQQYRHQTNESIPHKHSRWKNLHEIQDRFRAFFSS
jgi:hypothetical protein